jgi:hypothetical protein
VDLEASVVTGEEMRLLWRAVCTDVALDAAEQRVWRWFDEVVLVDCVHSAQEQLHFPGIAAKRCQQGVPSENGGGVAAAAQ